MMAVAAIGISAGALLVAKFVELSFVAPRPPAFSYLFRRDEAAAAWLAGAIMVAAAALCTARRIPDRLLVSRLAADPRTFIAAVTLLCAVAALLVYRRHPLAMDEYAPLFQAEAFARGRLTGKVPPELLPRLLPAGHWFLKGSPSGEIISMYWPGFALLLTPLAALRVPWLLNPLIGGASLFAIWALSRRLWPGTAAPGWAVLFTAASPAFVVNAISFYSMPAHLLANACFALLLLDPTPRRALFAGLIGSFALVLHNPLPHALFALPFFVFILLRPDRIRLLAMLALGYLPLTALLGVGWMSLESSLGPSPSGASGLLGMSSFLAYMAFGVPSKELALVRLMNLVELMLWAAPALVLLACIGAWTQRRSPPARLLLSAAAVTFIGYLIVPYDQGHGWGYRYFHSAWFVIPLFAAAAVEFWEPGGAALRRMALVTSLLGLFLCNGLRFQQVGTFIAEHLAQIPSPAGGKRQIVFVRISRGYYSIDLVQNDPFLESSRWVLISRGDAEDAEFMRRSFPEAHMVAQNPVASVWQTD